MNLIFDGLILIICALAIYLGAKRGFIKSVMSACTLVAALFVAYAFTPTLSAHIMEQSFIQSIAESITDTIKSLAANGTGTYNLDRLFAEKPDAFTQILDRYKADMDAIVSEVPLAPDVPSDTVEFLSNQIANPVASAIAGVLAFLTLFVATVVVLKILTWLLDLIFQLPVLKTANTMLGLLLGIVCAALWAWVLSSLSVTFIHAMSSISPQYFKESIVESTVIVKFFSTYSLVDVAGLLIP